MKIDTSNDSFNTYVTINDLVEVIIVINMTLVSGAKLRCRITIRFQIIKKKKKT